MAIPTIVRSFSRLYRQLCDRRVGAEESDAGAQTELLAQSLADYSYQKFRFLGRRHWR